jgi:hypothetical protein
MTSRILRIQQATGKLLLPVRTHWYLFLGYLAVLPVAGTVALRNLVLAILVIQSLLFCIVAGKTGNGPVGVKKVPAWLVLWAAFLVLAPLITQDRGVAWRELGGQWLGSLLAWFVAFVVVWRISPTDSDFLSIALASAIYPFFYLALFLWAWVGGFGYPAYIEDISWGELLGLLAHNIGKVTVPNLASFPWGFRGFDPIHANLGAAAAQAFVALAAWGLARWQKGLSIKSVGLALLLGGVSLGPVLANSRASVLCIGALIPLALVIAGRLLWRKRPPDDQAKVRRLVPIGIAAASLVCALGFLAYQSYEKDPRWRTLYYKATMGFWVPDAMEAVCNGIGQDLESAIRSRLAGMTSDDADEIVQGMGGDGGRVLVMRAGLALVLEHPMGMDGSRHSYKRLIRERCGKVPVIDFAHPHQGWIDLALALGWAGMLLYFGMFLYLLRVASVDLSKRDWTGWGFGLLMLCFFWVLRGFFDSVYREHYLQMQAAMIGFFWSGLLQETGARKPGAESDNS